MRSVLNKSGQTLIKTLHQESEILPCQNLQHGVLGRQFDNFLISHQFIPNTTTTTTIRTTTTAITITTTTNSTTSTTARARVKDKKSEYLSLCLSIYL